ncbi:MAG: NUDIX domain-containing protein [Candidatus Paceibacterota bacterium]
MGKTYIYKSALIEIQDRKVLVTRSHNKDTWYFAGGKREEGESDEQALVREIKEELNVDLDPVTILYYGTFEAQAHGKPEGTIVKLKCYQAKYQGTLKPSNEIGAIDWFHYSKKELTSLVSQFVFDDLKVKNLID